MSEAIEEIYELYQSIIGVPFIGVYHGNWTLVQGSDTKVCSVVAMRFDPYEISPVLNAIVMQSHAHSVWKAITGPEGVPPTTEYWVWSEGHIKETIPFQKQTYKIIDVVCFADEVETRNRKYSGGVGLYLEICDAN